MLAKPELDEGSQQCLDVLECLRTNGWVQRASERHGSYCILGAFQRCGYTGAYPTWAEIPGIQKIHKALTTIFKNRKDCVPNAISYNIVNYNDVEGRTFADIEDLLLKAAYDGE